MNQTYATFDPTAAEPPNSAVERVLDNLEQQGPSPSSAGQGFDPLCTALLQSRQRWRDMSLMAGDVAFETDRAGRFVFLAPDPAFGWPVASLLGQNADTILAGGVFSQNINPFRPASSVRARRAWLRRPDGSSVCFSFAAAPLLDEAGTINGARGLGQDMSKQDGHDATVATSLRRGEMLDNILWRMRQETLAPHMMQVVLESVTAGMGLEGAAVIDMTGDGILPTILHQTGMGITGALHKSLILLGEKRTEPSLGNAADGHIVLVCPCPTRFGEQAGLALWRPIGGCNMDGDDVVLASSATGLVRVILEHESIQREMTRQARTDPLTGLLNRRAFFDEMGRRLERLERDNTPGTLLFIDLDHFKALNDCRGHDIGDEALTLTAAILRSIVRAQDLVARLGGDEFAVWLDATDDLSAAERAEHLRVEGPKLLHHLAAEMVPPLTMSIGIATRWPGRGENVETLMQRADQVMYQVKRSGRGNWLVSRSEDAS